MDFLYREFQKFPDHRAGNALRYDLADVLKSAFAMFSLKVPSLLDFKKRTEPERNNLRSIYRIRGAIPCDNQMRGILDQFGPQHLRTLFRACFQRLIEAGVISEYCYLVGLSAQITQRCRTKVSKLDSLIVMMKWRLSQLPLSKCTRPRVR
ncbi:MAG TPA: hypothetical protein VJZ77_07745 [Blastocatellia bacterium]|nr:hypothetical protein [Blastocatellia bacterium]